MQECWHTQHALTCGRWRGASRRGRTKRKNRTPGLGAQAARETRSQLTLGPPFRKRSFCSFQKSCAIPHLGTKSAVSGAPSLLCCIHLNLPQLPHSEDDFTLREQQKVPEGSLSRPWEGLPCPRAIPLSVGSALPSSSDSSIPGPKAVLCSRGHWQLLQEVSSRACSWHRVSPRQD